MPTILDALQAVHDASSIPMHMPGHKRNCLLAPYLSQLSAHLDITEIHNCDCLHHADGIILNAMKTASRLFHVPHSYLLINGSTCGILAGIHTATRRGDTVLMVRGCHKAVYNAVALCGLNTEYLLQPQSPEGYYGAISPQDIARRLQQNPAIKLVVVTSPTYEGYLSDIAQIAEICHSHRVPLLVDEAHGAHLGFSPYFTGSAVHAGADIVIQSLHKTLPSLTQTGIAHLQGSLVSPRQFSSSLSIFETSSPSYLLMASIDGCLQLLSHQGDALFANWQEILEDFYCKSRDLQHLHVVQEPSHRKDPSKILISTANTSIDGTALKDRLREEFHIELEMAYGDYALAMTGMGDCKETVDALLSALQQIDKTLTPSTPSPLRYTLDSLPIAVIPTHMLHNSPVLPRAPQDAINAVCASYIWAYPPGVPIIAPGERISPEVLTLLQTLKSTGVELQDTLGFWPEEIGTIQPEPLDAQDIV